MATPTEPKPKTIDDITPLDTLHLCLSHLVEVLKAQWVDFSKKSHCAKIERRAFHRFIINDAATSFGIWQYGDDVNLHFLTHDNEARWAEVVTEALGVEVAKADLNAATKDGKLDFTDDRLCHFRDGRRTQYWYLKHTNSANCRIILHYCRVSSTWLGTTDVARNLQECETVMPSWPDEVPHQLYTRSLQAIQFQQEISLDPVAKPIFKKVYPLARAWTEVHNLWKPELIDAQMLFYACCSPLVLGRYDKDATNETLLIQAWKTWACWEFHVFVSNDTRRAMQNAAADSLKDMETMLISVRTARTSLAGFPQLGDTPTAQQQQPIAITTPTPAQRFRDARSVLNRLRYDLSHAGVEYDVGYTDRFEGMKWMSLQKWGGKSTEEEDFIPEHRVRQIVRVRDEMVVWDRERRVDRTGEA